MKTPRTYRRGSARVIACSLGAALIISSAGSATAQPSEDVKHALSLELVREGNQLWAARDYLGAADRYDRAYEIERAKTLQLWAARGLERGGKWVEAHERYTMVMELPADATSQDWDAARMSRRDAARLEQQIPRLTIALDGAAASDVVVWVNGEALPVGQVGVARWLNPGLVRIAAVPKAPRSRLRGPKERTETLVAGERRIVTLRFGMTPELDRGYESANGGERRRIESSDTQRVLAYVAFGVSGAVLLTGGAFGWMALNDESELKQRCPRDHCPAQLASDVDAFESKRTIGVAGLLSGGLLGAAGLALYLTAPSHEPAARERTQKVERELRLRAGLSGQGAYLSGQF